MEKQIAKRGTSERINLNGLCMFSAIIKPQNYIEMKKHRHIPMGNGHITWHGKADPTQEQLDAFQKMHDIALNMHFVVGQSEQLCECYEPDNTTAMNCKHCKQPKFMHDFA